MTVFLTLVLITFVVLAGLPVSVYLFAVLCDLARNAFRYLESGDAFGAAMCLLVIGIVSLTMFVVAWGTYLMVCKAVMYY